MVSEVSCLYHFWFWSILANANKDFEVSQPGDDTISSIRFSSKANFLIASSWDNNIRCWEIQPTGQSVAKAMQSHTKPILDSCWHDDGTKVFTAGADNMGKMWDLQSNQAVQVNMEASWNFLQCLFVLMTINFLSLFWPLWFVLWPVLFNEIRLYRS